MSGAALRTAMAHAPPPRVWSLLVTVFGDLAQAPGARLSGGALRAIVAQIGIKPEATRVALHRLRKEGWIETAKAGRRSLYALTQEGRAQSAEASARIYPDNIHRPGYSGGETTDTDTDTDTVWLITGPDGHAPKGGWAIAERIWLCKEPPAPGQWLTAPIKAPHPLPGWARTALCPPTLLAQAQGLAEDLARLETWRAGAALAPLEAAALRVMVVHEWRRLVLRSPDLPQHCFPEDWAGPVCAALVRAHLKAVPAPDLETLEADAARLA